jgi:O-methyltransferase
MNGTLKTTIQSVLRGFGHQLVRIPSQSEESTPTEESKELPGAYERVRPGASYAPWKADEEFISTFASIKYNTLVDIYRCWELWTLVEQSTKFDGDIIEIGVWRGGTGALMAKKADLAGARSHIYLCDTFSGVVKAGVNDTFYQGGEHADTSRGTVEHLIHDVLKLSNVTILQGIFPDQSCQILEEKNAKFSLCHIDVDVYQSAKDIMDWIWGRMVKGGIVVYDDYGFATCEGITRFVNEQLSIKDRLIFHNLNGHAVVVKISGD